MLTRAVTTYWKIATPNFWMGNPTMQSWRLNERHYGALQGLNKAETAAIHGDEKVKIWRRSYDIPPPEIDLDDERHPRFENKYKHLPVSYLPRAESLKMTIERTMPFWYEHIVPSILLG